MTIYTHTTIPAEPGWFVVQLLGIEKGDDDFEYNALSEHPVLAWDIQRWQDDERVLHDVMPITVDRGIQYGMPWAIKQPDGQYYIREGIHGEVTCSDKAFVIQRLVQKQSGKLAAAA